MTTQGLASGWAALPPAAAPPPWFDFSPIEVAGSRFASLADNAEGFTAPKVLLDASDSSLSDGEQAPPTTTRRCAPHTRSTASSLRVLSNHLLAAAQGVARTCIDTYLITDVGLAADGVQLPYDRNFDAMELAGAEGRQPYVQRPEALETLFYLQYFESVFGNKRDRSLVVDNDEDPAVATVSPGKQQRPPKPTDRRRSRRTGGKSSLPSLSHRSRWTPPDDITPWEAASWHVLSSGILRRVRWEVSHACVTRANKGGC